METIYVLVYCVTGKRVKIGDLITDFRGDTATVTGWAEPHKPSSTGRVYTDQGQYFPSVFALEFRKQK